MKEKNQDKYHLAKNYLSKYKTLKVKFESTHEKMVELNRKITDPQGGGIIEMVAGSHETRQKSENVISNYIYLLEELCIKQDKRLKEIEYKQKEIDNYIKENTNTELQYIILFLYYIEGYNLENISVKLSYSYSHTVRNYVNALKNIQKALEEKGEIYNEKV